MWRESWLRDGINLGIFPHIFRQRNFAICGVSYFYCKNTEIVLEPKYWVQQWNPLTCYIQLSGNSMFSYGKGSFKSVTFQVPKKMVFVCNNIGLIWSLFSQHPLRPPLPSARLVKGRTCEGHKQAACCSWWHMGRTKPRRSSYSGGQGQERSPKA